jgi:molybdate transport system substrate-binding protein
MKIRSWVAMSSIACVLSLGSAAEAAEIKVLSAIAMQRAVEDLGPKFERATGHKLTVTFATLGAIVKRLQDGDTADVVIAPQQGIDTLVKDGKAVAGNVTVLARTGISLAVRKGASRPDISSPEALKRALLAAKSISYTPPAGGGASGVHFAKVLERLGIAEEMKSKTVFPKGVEVGAVIANGEAEMGVQQNQELVSIPGIEVIGPLPGDLQATIVLSAAVMASSNDAAAAKALVDFLRAAEAAVVLKAKGMEPATP